jgi:hypothetical protein
VDSTHEPVEMHALPALWRQRVAKHVHHHRFAPANAAPQVEAFDWRIRSTGLGQ